MTTQCGDQFAGRTCRLPVGHDGYHRGSRPTTGAAQHLSRDELIRIAAAAIHDAGGDRPVTTGTAVVHALHQLGALPIGEPT